MNHMALLVEASDTVQSVRRLRTLLKRNGGGVVLWARNTLGFTQRELADRLGVTVQYICNLEKGRQVMSPELAVKMLHVLRDEKGQ